MNIPSPVWPKRALIISKKNIFSDPRPLRFSKYFYENGFAVDILCENTLSSSHSLKPYEFFQPQPLGRPLHSSFSRTIYLFALFLLAIFPRSLFLKRAILPLLSLDKLLHNFSEPYYYDIIVSHDPLMALLVIGLSRCQPILDLREFYVRQYDNSALFNLFHRPFVDFFVRVVLAHCGKFIVVSRSQSLLYYKTYKIKPAIIRSLPLKAILDSPRPIPASCPIRLVYHGSVDPNRGIADLVPCVSQFPDKYTLDIFAVGSDSLLSDLKCLAAKTSNVFVREPLNFQDIISSLSSYDLGIAFIRPSTTNLRFCLPNKLFEYIQASLPVLTGPTPDIVKIVSSWKIGFVADSFSTCAFHRSLQFIDLAMVKAAKKNTFHAKDILCWEYESKILDRLISS